MRSKIDCFLACRDINETVSIIPMLRDSRTVQHIHLIVNKMFGHDMPEGCSAIEAEGLTGSDTIRKIAGHTNADYVLLSLKATHIDIDMPALSRMLRVAYDSDAAMVYSDHYSIKDGIMHQHPAIDYQTGSIRDDFDFGSLVLIKSELLHKYSEINSDTDYKYAGWYDLRLFLSRNGSIFHINEYLYTEVETDLRDSGVRQFDYVNPANREVQKEMEEAATAHLEAIGAKIDCAFCRYPDFTEQDFSVEASVIIPVRNREKTIVDAINSALGQKADFEYNVIVVDNHSTDNTSRLIESIPDPRLIHLIPTRNDLGIGGCWNMAVNDDRCGRFAIQLDSDDLYSSPDTIQTIVNAFRKQKAAMVIGSYRMCDFNLNTLPPGLIDHREWTDENGANNALRINGLGAPRAFFTPLLRQIQFPNTSYGEDYAIGLIFSRRYRIGRIYDELYLCRRWSGNSDAALPIEKINANNLYKDRLRTLEISARHQMMTGKTDIMADSPLYRFFYRQIETWEEARKRYRDMHNIQTKELTGDTFTIIAQHNPARILSTGASIDKDDISRRQCFLCEDNRPDVQTKRAIDSRFDLLVNPYPILPTHFTIPLKSHSPQQIYGYYEEIYKILEEYPEITVFYNGPKCGASAPDHAHFQAGTSGVLPLQHSWARLSRNLTPVVAVNENEGIWIINDYPCTAFVIKGKAANDCRQLFTRLYHALPMKDGDTEPMMNIVAWKNSDSFITVVFPRSKHRPDCYYANGSGQCLISPGALDMAGLLVMPRKEDFNKITAEKAFCILKEVSLSDKDIESVAEKIKECVETNNSCTDYTDEPEVKVGIVSGQKITFSLNAPYIAKGETITGEQIVEFSEGGILWNGNQYRELTFTPQSANASFSLHEVTIGKDFHWERKETQVFNGTLKLVVEADKITAINELPVESYLTSVISSEMKDTSSIELLKAHAVISRSWLLAQMEKRKHLTQGAMNNFFSFIKKDDEIIRWYDREDHTIFDVCADDHCQRYQGITKINNPHVIKAIEETRGQVLSYGNEICDARFSKCCGGATEEFQYCWENTPKHYLAAIYDTAAGKGCDLTNEEDAEKWILTSPEAFCNTNDRNVLSQVLNDYDQETADFYRWKKEYSQDQIARLINDKQKDDFGDIKDLIPLERGKSGRISKLKIVGTKKSLTIGKELEIRRTLCETHLYSSAFVVEKSSCDSNGTPQKFILHGAGWGHGVGLCQIGAAMMGEHGFKYNDILLHYYSGAEIKKLYK